MNAQMTAAELYADRARDMRAEDLLDDLESSVRQNHYGSHDDQIRIVRAELLRRLSTEFKQGARVAVRGDVQWTGTVIQADKSRVSVVWDHQPDAFVYADDDAHADQWIATSDLVLR